MGIMRLMCIGALLVPLMVSLFTCIEGRYYPTSELGSYNYNYAPRGTPKYDRIKEVISNSICDELIDSASELGSDDNRVNRISHDLSFSGGDWFQQSVSGSGTTRPLIPFLDYDSFDESTLGSPMNLSSFRITDVNSERESEKTVSVNGVLDLFITRYGPVSEMGSGELNPQFQMQMGNTQLSVFFQGVYMESEKNGGERVMCLLGTAKVPDQPWRHIDASDYRLPLFQDEKILLVLRYPKKFTLTQREIQGEMRSLRLTKNLNYFDKVQISSQLSTEQYKFGSQAVHKACDSYPYSDSLLDGGIDVYKGSEFCSFFSEIQGRGRLVIMPNWKCKGTDEFCSKLGPFVTPKGFNGVQLLIQNVRCEQQLVNGDISEAKVYLVLRASSSQGSYFESMRNGLGNTTLAAEGVWKSSNGQLCMVGCLGIVDAEGNGCDSRVCFYIPTTISITQRSALVGSISSLNAETPSYSPLPFGISIHNGLMWRSYRYTNLRYKYSKIRLAGALLEKEEPSSFGNVIKKSLLNFPKLQDNEDYNSSASLLAEDLTFHARAFPDPTPSPSSLAYTYVMMRILTVGSVFSSRVRNSSFARYRNPYHEKAEYKMKQLLVNVSGQLSIRGANDTSLSLEGLYDPVNGKMYLIGCRDVKASSPKISFESDDLGGGFDCSTDVVISYPSVTAQWLLNPGARISITSKRPEDDTYYFKPIKLKTSPITYRRQRKEALSEKAIEGILRVSTLSVVVICILLQLFYIRSSADFVPFVSIVMLVIQALGYGLPLITDIEALFKRKQTESPYGRSSYELENSQSNQPIESTTNILVLVAFLLTLRLLQKVWKSRVRLLRLAPNEPRRVPNDKLILLATLVIHIIGFICAVSFRASNTNESDMVFMSEFGSVGSSVSTNSRTPKQWMILLEEYMGLVQDLFLFPQVVGNLVWQIDSKPLRKFYYIGISIVRLIPHLYDYFKASSLNPYFSRDYVFVDRDSDFYSKFSDVFIPLMTVLLAVLVFVQQRWSYSKLSDALVIRRCRLLPLSRKAYQKLPSESMEAELSSSGNGTGTCDQEA